MIFTPDQIQTILEVIDSNVLYYIGTSIGIEGMSKVDLEILKQHGIDPKSIESDFPQFLQAYHWGRLSQALGHKNAQDVTYPQFLKFLRKGQYIPLSPIENEMYSLSKQRTYTHLKGLGERMKQTVNGIILEEDQKLRELKEKVIKKEISKGIYNRKALSEIVSEIGKKTGDWNRDLGRIVDSEYNTIFQEGRAAQIAKEGGLESKVYKDVYVGACKHCIKAYLTHGIGSKPIVYLLKDLINNGTNIGLKQADWKPVVGSHHPWCRCNLYEINPNEVWDEEKGEFTLPKLKEEEKLWTKKDKITVGDKIYYV